MHVAHCVGGQLIRRHLDVSRRAITQSKGLGDRHVGGRHVERGGDIGRSCGDAHEMRTLGHQRDEFTVPPPTTLPRVVPLAWSRAMSSPVTDIGGPSTGGSVRKSSRIPRLTGHRPGGAPDATT